MKRLFINACLRNNSRTRLLAEYYLSLVQGETVEVNLSFRPVAPLTEEMLSFRDGCVARGDYTDAYFNTARQFAEADEIVIAAPCWDLGFPAMLKAYLESVMILGLTFRYSESGIPQGLCRAKKLIYITTAGGPLLPEFDHGFSYIRSLAVAYWGIPESVCYSAEGLDIANANIEEILYRTKQKILMDVCSVN